MIARQKDYKKSFMRAVAGTLLVALCCFTPLLVIVLSLVGLSFLTPYLDYVLLPALAMMLVVAILAYRRWHQSQRGVSSPHES